MFLLFWHVQPCCLIHSGDGPRCLGDCSFCVGAVVVVVVVVARLFSYIALKAVFVYIFRWMHSSTHEKILHNLSAERAPPNTILYALQLWRNLQIPKTDSPSQRQRRIPYDPCRKQSRSGTTETSKSNRLRWQAHIHPVWSSEEIIPSSLENSHLHTWKWERCSCSFAARIQQDVSERIKERLQKAWCREGRLDGNRSVMKWWIFSCWCAVSPRSLR